MRLETRNLNFYGEICLTEIMIFDSLNDRIEWRRLWQSWITLKMGLRAYQSREPNLPEGLSESAFCIYSGSARLINIYGKCNKSADTYNLQTMETEQIKATSVENDLTSFGPNSRWDKLYFLDFYRNGDMDGSFDIYQIDSDLIYNTVVNQSKNETFRDQQAQGRRPRLSLKKEIIKRYGIEPIAVNVII